MYDLPPTDACYPSYWVITLGRTRSLFRHLSSFRMEGCRHSCDQCIPIGCHQAHTESGRSRGVEQVVITYHVDYLVSLRLVWFSLWNAHDLLPYLMSFLHKKLLRTENLSSCEKEGSRKLLEWVHWIVSQSMAHAEESQ